ncbi:hypothetical protein WI23_29115 [Burkholderia oklahomensis C6786]|nr:hypothetical protein WI23_29115 [Burkholderia oklahomensis C6786]KUY52821.1 hypothetical protein WI23_24080 [Burkholderia oklahomensis C6786]
MTQVVEAERFARSRTTWRGKRHAAAAHRRLSSARSPNTLMRRHDQVLRKRAIRHALAVSAPMRGRPWRARTSRHRRIERDDRKARCPGSPTGGQTIRVVP